MSRKPSLPNRFPKAPFVAKVKLWTPDRNILEAEGPYNETAGRLLAMVAACAHPRGKKRKAMEDCLAVLTGK